MQKVIGMVGYVNKTDLLINLAKVLTITGKSVLVIDGTVEERVRYTIPAFVNQEKEYLANFDGVDYASGFMSIQAIKEYIFSKTQEEKTYDIILIDIDNVRAYDNFRQSGAFNKIFFYLEYTNISFNKNIQLLDVISYYEQFGEKSELRQVTCRQYVTRTSEKYFANIISRFPVKWNERVYELPFLDQDRIADIELQQSGYIDMKRHTKEFISLVADVAADILEDVHAAEIRQMIKKYSRRRS